MVVVVKTLNRTVVVLVVVEVKAIELVKTIELWWWWWRKQ